MSIQNLFSSNDYSIYIGDLHSSSQTINGTLIVNGNETLNGSLIMRNNDVVQLGASPNFWGIYKNSGVNENLIISQNGSAVNQNISLQIGNGYLLVPNMQLNGALQDYTTNNGTVGQVLTSTGSQILWQHPMNYVYLQSGTAILTGNFVGNYGFNTNAFNSDIHMLTGGILRDVFVNTSVAPGIGENYTLAIYKNDVATGNTVVLVDSEQSKSIGFDIPFNTGDKFAFLHTKSGGAADPTLNVTFSYYPV